MYNLFYSPCMMSLNSDQLVVVIVTSGGPTSVITHLEHLVMKMKDYIRTQLEGTYFNLHPFSLCDESASHHVILQGRKQIVVQNYSFHVYLLY